MLPLLMSIHERVRNSRAVIRVRARLRRGEEVLHTHTHRRRRIIHGIYRVLEAMKLCSLNTYH